MSGPDYHAPDAAAEAKAAAAEPDFDPRAADARTNAARAAESDFRPRFPWVTGDLQTLRNRILRPRVSFADAPPRRMAFEQADGTGDALIGDLHFPAERTDRPLAVLIHGLTGCAESDYVRVAARHLLDRGFPVLRLNLRGAGISAGRCREQYHAGRTADLLRVFALLRRDRAARAMVAIGFSLGGSVLLKLLAESGTRAPVLAAASVSAPIDLAAAAATIRKRRNALYQRYLLARMKREAQASRDGLAEPLARAAVAASSIVAFDDTVIAPRYGYESAADYYARCSAAPRLGDIAVPTLLIHARDDPWIPAAAYDAATARAIPGLRFEVTDGGGHVGFHERGSRVPRHARRIADFLRDCVT